MNKSEEKHQIKNIYQRMNCAMSEIKRIEKSGCVNNQYKVVTHDMVTSEVRGPLIENGIVTSIDITDIKQNGNRTEVSISMWFINMDNPEDRYKVDSIGYGIDSQDKGPGKAISYACKYALLKAFNIETGDDPDKDVCCEYNYQKQENRSDSNEKQILLTKITSIVGLDSERKSRILSFYSQKDGKNYMSLADMDILTLKDALSYLNGEKNIVYSNRTHNNQRKVAAI